jgi:uncharacterized repeat protein (TIGR03847 family)
MPRHIELNPVTQFTVGTIGRPGQRTFYLQGSKGSNTVSLVIEKQQAAMLADSLEALLEELDSKYPQPADESQEQVFMDFRLREPVEELFRVGNMGLGFNEADNRVVVVAYEITAEDEEDEDVSAVSFWATRAQVKSLVPHIYEVVSAGRPICGNCGRPIDPEGHFCPHRNGHVK